MSAARWTITNDWIVRGPTSSIPIDPRTAPAAPSAPRKYDAWIRIRAVGTVDVDVDVDGHAIVRLGRSGPGVAIPHVEFGCEQQRFEAVLAQIAQRCRRHGEHLVTLALVRQRADHLAAELGDPVHAVGSLGQSVASRSGCIVTPACRQISKVPRSRHPRRASAADRSPLDADRQRPQSCAQMRRGRGPSVRATITTSTRSGAPPTADGIRRRLRSCRRRVGDSGRSGSRSGRRTPSAERIAELLGAAESARFDRGDLLDAALRRT